MRGVKSVVLALAIALALTAAAACQAKLDGAPCPCVEPEYTCVELLQVCRHAGDGGGEIDARGSDTPDAGPAEDGGVDPDGGFFPDASFL